MSLSSGIAINSVVKTNNVVTVQIPGSLTVAQTKVLLQAVWTGQQNYLASLTPQPAQYYGFAWTVKDGQFKSNYHWNNLYPVLGVWI